MSEAPTFVQPFITRLVPDNSGSGTLAQLDIYGEDFQPTSQIVFDFVPIPTIYIDETHLRSAGPFDVGVLGDKPVYVETPTMADSNILTFTVMDQPVLLTLVPAAGLENEVIAFAVTGTDFQPDSVIEFDGVVLLTTYIDDQNLEATDPLDIGALGVKDVVVNTGALVSNALQFDVTAAPIITELIPPQGPEDTLSPLTVIGMNFIAGAEIIWDGAAIPTTFVSATQVDATAPFDLGATRDVPVLVRDARVILRDARQAEMDLNVLRDARQRERDVRLLREARHREREARILDAKVVRERQRRK